MSGDYSQRIAKLYDDYVIRGVRLVLLNANDNETDAEVDEHRSNSGLPLPVYRDRGAQVASLLSASVTPSVVMLDRTGSVSYFGAIDDSRVPERVNRQFLRDALEATLSGKQVPIARTRVMGCTIKQK